MPEFIAAVKREATSPLRKLKNWFESKPQTRIVRKCVLQSGIPAQCTLTNEMASYYEVRTAEGQ